MQLPEPYYAGEIRDSDPQFPELFGSEVQVGGVLGTPSKDVPADLAQLETRIQTACTRLDAAVPRGVYRSKMRPFVPSSLRAATSTASGYAFTRSQTATGARRLWATWIELRYGLPPFIEIKPRPAGQPYAAAAAASMHGDHRLCIRVFEQMLRAKLGQR